MSVPLLCRSPGQIIVEISTTLTVDACCVMLAITLRIHLQRDRQRLLNIVLNLPDYVIIHNSLQLFVAISSSIARQNSIFL